MEGIYKFAHHNRECDVEGIFVADSEMVKEVIGAEVSYSTGNWIEFDFVIESDMFQLVSDDPEVVKVFKDNNMNCGVDPIELYEYMMEYADDDEVETPRQD